MQKYFISEENMENCIITGDDVFHIKNVMRSHIGDEILVCDNKNTYLVKIIAIADTEVSFTVVEKKEGNCELPFFTAIYQGYPKGDKLEDIIKHGTELGANLFVPVMMKRSVVKLEPKKIDSRVERLNKIAKEAAEQCHRDTIPKIPGIMSLKDIDYDYYDVKIVCYEENAKLGELTEFKKAIRNLPPNAKIAFFIGPEGGFDEKEIDYLKEKGCIMASVGKRILRTETVVFYCLSALSYEWELKE